MPRDVVENVLDTMMPVVYNRQGPNSTHGSRVCKKGSWKGGSVKGKGRVEESN